MRVKKLFEPGQIGRMKVRNRIVMAPMGMRLTQYPFTFTKEYVDAVEVRARGGVGLVTTCHVNSESILDPYPMRAMNAALDREYTLRIFALLTEVVHRHGAKIAVQLSAGTGAYADVPSHENWPAAPSVVPIRVMPRLTTDELSLGKIWGLVEAFGKAAAMAEAVGFDAVLVHCHGGYLIDQFLNPYWNKRTDKYGGSLDNRMRFMTDCIENARSKVSRDFPLIAHITVDHMMEGCNSVEETVKIARRLEELGMSALYLGTGCYETIDRLIPPMYSPQGCKVSAAQPVREAVGIPVIVDGRISDPEHAERLLAEGKTDFIGVGRQLLADPDWPRKVKQGRTADIRPCIYCNSCNDLKYRDQIRPCAVNPALGREREKDYRFWPAAEKKKVLVIGGGPAGIRAATVAALRGHKVTLYEKSDKLGGNLWAASEPPFKATIGPLITWLAREADKAGVKTELGKEASVRTVKAAKPDLVVIATGAEPVIPKVPGVKGANVVTAIDVDTGKAKVGKTVVIIGGGLTGLETALHLAQTGKKVTILEMLPEIGADVGRIAKMSLLRLLPENGVTWLTDVKVNEITRDGVVATVEGDRGRTFKADSVVLATGMKARNGLLEALDGIVPEVYIVGDAREPRRIIDAFHEGEIVARDL